MSGHWQGLSLRTFFPRLPAALVAFAVLLRLVLMVGAPGFEADVRTFHAWAYKLAHEGPWHFYETIWCDYTPAYLYVLGLIGMVDALLQGLLGGNAVGPLVTRVLVKLPGVVADFVTLAAFLRLTDGRIG
ncbi:MAG: hypothetical protein VKP57_10305, partial [Candidatus Sericytochromatia bacterium]|nr:hypothetical protein [Candidatus Sericytochromatia bacterium]